MALRKGHGAGADSPIRIEVPPVDELRVADVQPAPEPAPSSPVRRRQSGQIADSAAAKELGRRGGLARAARARAAQQFVTSLRISKLPGLDPSDLARPFVDEAERFFLATRDELARETDGIVSAKVSAILRGAAMKIYQARMYAELATSRALTFVKDGDTPTPNATLAEKSARLDDMGRQGILAAHHLQTLEAEARARRTQAAPAWFIGASSSDADTTEEP